MCNIHRLSTWIKRSKSRPKASQFYEEFDPDTNYCRSIKCLSPMSVVQRRDISQSTACISSGYGSQLLRQGRTVSSSWVQRCMWAISEKGKEMQRHLGNSEVWCQQQPFCSLWLQRRKRDPWLKAIVHVQQRGQLGWNLLPIGSANLREQSANAGVCSLCSFNSVEVISTFP